MGETIRRITNSLRLGFRSRPHGGSENKGAGCRTPTTPGSYFSETVSYPGYGHYSLLQTPDPLRGPEFCKEYYAVTGTAFIKDRKLSLALLMRLFTVPTLMPNCDAISS